MCKRKTLVALVAVALPTWAAATEFHLHPNGQWVDPQQQTSQPDDGKLLLDRNGFYMGVGIGEYGLHWRNRCPRWYSHIDGYPDQIGCLGSEPFNFLSQTKLGAFGANLGWRFSRHLALEFPFYLMTQKDNSVARPTELDSRVYVNALVDFQVRVRGDFSLTRHLSAYATVGPAMKVVYGVVTQNLQQQTCIATQPGPNNIPQCVAYWTTYLQSAETVSQGYLAASGGISWSFRKTALLLNYQPPIGRGFAFNRLSLEFQMYMSDQGQ